MLDSEVDKTATFAEVESIVDGLYENKQYQPYLQTLTEPYDQDIRATRDNIMDILNGCADTGDAVPYRVIYCAGLTDYLVYASQYVPDSGDPTDAAINAAFLRAATILRSAAASDGVPQEQLDGLIGSGREFYQFFCGEPEGVPCGTDE